MKGNNTKVLRSRILEYFPKEAMEEIKKLVYNNRINDINDKVQILMSILDRYDIDYDELGTGTNRTAIFIDGYVFKIALDKWGIRDNDQEFTLSEELQPYVIKVYECNGIIMVCEYVVVITKEEFAERKSQIKRILGDLSNEYLLGDIGTINKNFANWGYRDSQELVALDFAYIYRIIGSELKCDCEVAPMLEYTPDYDKLVCPHCRKRYQFMDVRRRISKDMETAELEMSKSRAYQITEKIEKVETDGVDNQEEESEGPTFKFSLHDYLMYKDMEEKKAMEKQRVLEEEKRYETIIDIEANQETTEDDMLDEVERLLAVKNGELPPEAVRVQEEEYEDGEEIDEAQYEEARLEIEKQNEELNQFIKNMNKSEEDEEEFEVSEEDMYEEIMRLQNGNTKVETEEVGEPDCAEDDKEETRVIAPDTLGAAGEGTQTGYILCRPIKSAYIKKALRKPIVEEVKEEPVQIKSVSFQMLLDESVADTEIEPADNEEQALKDQISNLLVKYIAMKGVDTSELDLAIDLSFTSQIHQEKVNDNEIIVINNKSDEINVEPVPEPIVVEEIKVGALPEEEKDDQYDSYMSTLIAKYGQHEDDDIEGYQPQTKKQEVHEELIQGDNLEEELEKMYKEL